MMSEHKDTDYIRQSSSEESLHYECEQALLRKRHIAPSVEEEWQTFSQRIQQPGHLSKSRQRVVHMRHWITGLSIASIAAIALVLVGLFWQTDKMRPANNTLTLFTAMDDNQAITVEEEQPGLGESHHTILTENSKHVVKEGVEYTPNVLDFTAQSTCKFRTNVVKIPCKKVCKIILRDSTEVWLNAGSKLSFPNRFIGTKRKVKLEGEAYFKVARNENAPFIIQTPAFTTQVLGTEFNIKSYKNSEAHLTLVNGSVKVYMPEIETEVKLTPGQDIAYANKTFEMKEVDTSYYTQWRDGYFYFDNVYLSDILSDLGRWYNATIEMEQDSLLLNQRLHFVAERSECIDDVVHNLNAFDYLSVTIRGNKVAVRRKK